MTLTEKVDAAIKDAMRAKDATRLRGLREIKAQLLLAKTDGTGTELDEDREIKILQKMQKQRRQSIEIFQQNGRTDLMEKELEEVAVIEEFLPKPLSPEELEAAVRAIIAETGSSSMKDMGKVMGLAGQRLGASAEREAIAKLVKAILG